MNSLLCKFAIKNNYQPVCENSHNAYNIDNNLRMPPYVTTARYPHSCRVSSHFHRAQFQHSMKDLPSFPLCSSNIIYWSIGTLLMLFLCTLCPIVRLLAFELNIKQIYLHIFNSRIQSLFIFLNSLYYYDLLTTRLHKSFFSSLRTL